MSTKMDLFTDLRQHSQEQKFAPVFGAVRELPRQPAQVVRRLHQALRPVGHRRPRQQAHQLPKHHHQRTLKFTIREMDFSNENICRCRVTARC